MIKLGKYAIDADSFNYIVGELKTTVDKNGIETEYIYQPRYYRTVQDALASLLSREQRRLVSENDLSLSDAIREFSALEKKYEELLKNTLKEGFNE